MARAETATIARAQKAYSAQAACSLPTCGRGFVTLIDQASHDVLIMPMRCHRWSCPACAPVRLAQIRSLARRGHPERHIVLTLPADDSRSLSDSLHYIRSRYQVLVQQIRREFKVFEYMAVLELQKNGTPHLHILQRGTYIPWNWLSSHWRKLTGAWMVHVRKITRTENAINELVKYLAKTASSLEASTPKLRITTRSAHWIIDPPDTDPAYSEHTWEAFYSPLNLGDLREALQLFASDLQLAPGSMTCWKLKTRDPPTPLEISTAQEQWPDVYPDEFQLAVDLLRGSTHTLHNMELARQERLDPERQASLEYFGIPTSPGPNEAPRFA